MTGVELSRLPVTLADGSVIVVSVTHYPAETPVPDPVPDPTPTPVPADANTATIGTATYPLTGINPTAASNPVGAAFPGFRGPDQLVAYTRPLTRTVTNAHGAEVRVQGGVLGALMKGQTGGVDIPADGLVLSGHGKAATWLAANVLPGRRVEFTRTSTPTPTPTPVPQLGGRRTIALYLKDGSGRASDIPADVNQVRVAFAQGDPPTPTNWGGESTAETFAGLNAWRAAAPGRQVLISVGGAGGKVNVANRDAFIGGILEIERTLNLDGWDVDIEGSSLPVADVVAAARGLAFGREGSWVTSFVPPGGPPVGPYLDAAVQCYRGGLTVAYGQQAYDAPVSLDAALGTIQRAITAGLPERAVGIGMMVGSDSRHWTLDMCEQVLRAAVGRWPGLGSTYLWSEKYTEDDEWARRMAGVFA